MAGVNVHSVRFLVIIYCTVYSIILLDFLVSSVENGLFIYRKTEI